MVSTPFTTRRSRCPNCHLTSSTSSTYCSGSIPSRNPLESLVGDLVPHTTSLGRSQTTYSISILITHALRFLCGCLHPLPSNAIRPQIGKPPPQVAGPLVPPAFALDPPYFLSMSLSLPRLLLTSCQTILGTAAASTVGPLRPRTTDPISGLDTAVGAQPRPPSVLLDFLLRSSPCP